MPHAPYRVHDTDDIPWLSKLVADVAKECRGIDPNLIEQLAKLPFSTEEFRRLIGPAQRFLKLGYHPGGESASAYAYIFSVIVQFQTMQDALRAGASR